jgi:hypothetical protein
LRSIGDGGLRTLLQGHELLCIDHPNLTDLLSYLQVCMAAWAPQPFKESLGKYLWIILGLYRYLLTIGNPMRDLAGHCPLRGVEVKASVGELQATQAIELLNVRHTHGIVKDTSIP